MSSFSSSSFSSSSFSSSSSSSPSATSSTTKKRLASSSSSSVLAKVNDLLLRCAMKHGVARFGVLRVNDNVDEDPLVMVMGVNAFTLPNSLSTDANDKSVVMRATL
mmetsp:Transcript_4136/g.6015  ORF Transcript_4136/g.6015 Transcript_4136/m.6015 type:complete len:106 (-) Transcript_4136:350-667(-)